MLELSERRLASWERQGLVPCLSAYTFPDLVVLRTLVRLRESGVSPLKIRRAVAALREKLGSASDPLKELTILSDGRKITVQLGASKMEPVSGQLLLDFDRAELRRMLAFPRQPKASAAKAAEQERRGEALLWFEKALELERCAAPVAEVIQAYEEALELDPASAGVLVNLGTIYFHMRDWDKAERHYRRALEADPQYALAHFNLGNLFDEKGDRSQALLQYLMALRLDPNYRDAHYNLALLYQASGQLMRAVRHWKAYLKLDAASPWAAVARQELDRLRRATVIEGAKCGGVKAGA
jgi:tetratricopeptide (TPR) repeat protein